MDDDAGPAEGYGDPVILPSGRESAVILLAPGSRLVFTGELFVSVLAGAATIHGHHLVPGCVTTNSPPLKRLGRMTFDHCLAFTWTLVDPCYHQLSYLSLQRCTHPSCLDLSDCSGGGVLRRRRRRRRWWTCRAP